MNITEYRIDKIQKDEMFEALKFNDLEKMKSLIYSGYNINKDLVDGITPLMISALFNLYDFVELFLNHGADTNKKDIYKNNLLMYAAIHGSKELAEIIISRSKIQIDSKNLYGWTPLMFSIKFNNISFTKTLLENKANPNICLLDGTSILQFNEEKNGKDTILHNFLLYFGAKS